MTPSKFSKLPKEKQIVMMAKDVIKNIRAGLFTFAYGEFVMIQDSLTRDESLRKIMPRLLKNRSCGVCALGACFLSYVGYANKYNVSEGLLIESRVPPSELFSLLGKILSPKMLQSIEIAYECGDGFFKRNDKRADYLGSEHLLSDADFYAAANFGGKYRSQSNRMIAIMQNIIKNKGDFKP